MRLLIAVFFFISITASGQSMDRVRAYLDTLCAPGMHGRGAELQGEEIAANYLKGQFKEIGLKSFNGSYFQDFTYNINTFPGDCELKIGKKVLTPGKDFIVNSFSGPGSGKSRVVNFNPDIFEDEEARKEFLATRLDNKILVYDSKDVPKPNEISEVLLKKIYSAECVVELVDKLTAGLSTFQFPNPYFKVQREAYPEDAPRRIRYDLDAELKLDYVSQNVIGYIEGKTNPDSFVVVSAHYDHLGHMGKNVYFPGANDNGSGISMMLELAHYYAKPENTPDFSIAFMAFGAEEAGLIGSKYYVENPLFPLDKIQFLLNLDLLGTGDDGIMVVNGKVFEEYYDLLVEINQEKGYLKEVKKRGEAANSDHYFFTKQGVPSFFIYTLGGIAAYHDVMDVPSTLPLTEFKDVFGLLTDFVGKVAEVKEPVGN